MADEHQATTTLRDVYEYLYHQLECAGSPWTGGRASALPVIPGLYVAGVDWLSLPVTSCQFQRLQQAQHLSLGSRMVRVGAEDVSLQNPAWEPVFKSLVDKCTVALGARPGEFTAEMESLLVLGGRADGSEPSVVVPAAGPVGKANPTSVANLIIQLPSRFEGGTYKVSLGTRTEHFCPFREDTSPYCSSFLAFYPDAQPTVELPTTGFRASLVYSLNYTGKPEKKPSLDKLSQDRLSSLLNRLPESVQLLGVPVQSAELLEGLDRVMANALQDACAKTDHQWRVATAHVSRSDQEYGSYERLGLYGTRNREFRPDRTDREEYAFLDSVRSLGGTELDDDWQYDEEIALQSMDEGGILLVPAADVDEFWGEGEEGTIESEDSGYTYNQEVSRNIRYEANLLVVYRARPVRPPKRARSSKDGLPREVIVID